MNQHELMTDLDIQNYLLSGKSIITLHNEDTNRRFTFKFIKSKKNSDVYWVELLTMQNNNDKTSYKFIASFSIERGIVHSKYSLVSNKSLSFKTIEWFIRRLYGLNGFRRVEQYRNVKVYHSGRCGRCGALLTTPDSLKAGVGPECLKYLVRDGLYFFNNQNPTPETIKSSLSIQEEIRNELEQEQIIIDVIDQIEKPKGLISNAITWIQGTLFK